VNDRLDATKIEQLQGWAVRLAANGNDELRAAGKAILLLIEEIERSRVDVNVETPEEPSWEQARGEPGDHDERTMDRTLRSRLSRIRDRSSA
jgi:hypothetical protein